jgi:class 3 adenylate cyclase
MPKSQDTSNNQKYFEPWYITIQRGETIDWINDDTRDHTLLSCIFGQTTDLLRIGPIKPGETQSRQINYGISKIDYFCSIHPQELGTIVILEKREADLTNIEGLRMLSNTFNIKPSGSLAHIDSPVRKAREAALSGLEKPEALVKYFDPLTLEMLLNAETHQLQSKCLTIAFWDLSGFSDMCNQLIDDPSTIVHFLKKYFNEANKIIHKNDGILDKFIGDGVMAYFGYYDNAGNQAAINAINAAIELKEKFIVIKNEWIKQANLNPKNVEINVKCGIHTGDLLFGIIDTEYRNQITVVGSTVNFASRLEGKAENDEIMISEETKEKVEKIFTLQEEVRNIKSWGEVKVYLVKGKIN